MAAVYLLALLWVTAEAGSLPTCLTLPPQCSCTGSTEVRCVDMPGVFPAPLPPDTTALYITSADLVRPTVAPTSNVTTALPTVASSSNMPVTVQGCAVNRLTPHDFRGLAALEELAVTGCHVMYVNSKAFVDNPNLRYLNLSHNRLTYITADALKDARLDILDLSHNKLEVSSDAFRYLSGLTELRLDNNSDLNPKPATLQGLQSLRVLTLDHCRVSQFFTDQLKYATELRTLNMSHNLLPSLSSAKLAQQVPKLLDADFSDNQLTSGDFKSFVDLRLGLLDVSRNSIDSLGNGVLQGLSVVRLSVAGNEIASLSRGDFSPVAQNLKELDLSGNLLHEKSVEALYGLSKLRSLDLSRNKMTALTAEQLSWLSGISELRVGGNTWHCDCSIAPVRDYLLRRPASAAVHDTCHTPQDYHGRSVRSLSDEDISECRPLDGASAQRGSKTLGRDLGIMFAFIFVLLGLGGLGVFFWWRHKKRFEREQKLVAESEAPVNGGRQGAAVDNPAYGTSVDDVSFSPVSAHNSQLNTSRNTLSSITSYETNV